jgi:glycerol-3-phosphate acyltransferase PlsY
MNNTALGYLIAVAGYVLGGVPFGLLVARWTAGIDIREHGSGNIGATNVYRLLGWRAGVIVWTLDVGKGWAPVFVAHAAGLHPGWQIAAGLAAVIGHSFSPFLRFHGGKGAATSLGVMLGVMWPVGVIAFIIWALTIALTGYVSLGTILGALSLTPSTLLIYPGDRARLIFAVGASALTIARHGANIRRLLNGTEHRFRRSAQQEPGQGDQSHE